MLNTNDNKVSLSMKALEEEMIDVDKTEEVEEYISHEICEICTRPLIPSPKSTKAP